MQRGTRVPGTGGPAARAAQRTGGRSCLCGRCSSADGGGSKAAGCAAYAAPRCWTRPGFYALLNAARTREAGTNRQHCARVGLGRATTRARFPRPQSAPRLIRPAAQAAAKRAKCTLYAQWGLTHPLTLQEQSAKSTATLFS